jgi:hypothetical protein
MDLEFSPKNTPLYTNLEITEIIDGLIEIMYDNDKKLEYQPFSMKIILFEIFQNANIRCRNKLSDLNN